MWLWLFGPAIEEISIVNFQVENSDGADSNNICFALEVDPLFQYGDTLTYDKELCWEEELSEWPLWEKVRRQRSNTTQLLYMSCKEYDNFSRNIWTDIPILGVQTKSR